MYGKSGPRSKPSEQRPRAAWPWDDRGRSAITAADIESDMQRLSDLIRKQFGGHVPGVSIKVPACP